MRYTSFGLLLNLSTTNSNSPPNKRRRLNTNSTSTSLIKRAAYEDKIKKIEEEKVCLLESIRILSTESSVCSKVWTECAVSNRQESPGESITMNGNHERKHSR